MGHRSLAWMALGSMLLFGSCEAEPINRPRPDSGVGIPDSGVMGDLPLTPGMRFRYRGTLTFRDGVSNESSAIFELEYTLETVTDAGADSTLSARASGERTFDQNWSPTAGADSWVARLGPANHQAVGAAPVTFALSAVPEPPGPRDDLPHNGLFFLDLRQTEAIRTGWADAQADRSPGAIDPSQHPSGHWTLTLQGRDDSMAYYPDAVKLRDLSLEYDPRGYLVQAVELLGDSQQVNQPNGRFELKLISEPPP